MDTFLPIAFQIAENMDRLGFIWKKLTKLKFLRFLLDNLE
jgi:hypothetical protein